MLRIVIAFVRRDFLNWASYRLQALKELGGLLVTVLVLLAGRKLLGDVHPAFLAQYNTDYIGYLMVSITFIEVWGIGFLLSKNLRDSQAMGTLEVMMLSYLGIVRLLLCSIAFPVLMAFVRLAIFVLIAVTVFGLWHAANVLSVAAVFSISLLTMGCLGMLSSAFVLLLKQGDPIVPLYGVLNGLLSGAVFPPSALPPWIQAFSLLLPLTYALDGIRKALAGATVLQIGPQLLTLIGFFLVLLPITLWTLAWATRRAKAEGSLVQY